MAKVAPLLDLELVELDRANCCGAGVIAEHNQELADALNARTFAMAQQVQGAAGMMNICSTCQGAQSECQQRLDASSEYRGEVNTHLQPEGLSYEAGGEWWNKNFLWILAEEIGFDALRERVTRPLEGLRIAPFYGCYIVRPSKRLGFDEHPEREQYLGLLIEALGGEAVEYAGARKCCGFPLITMNRTTSLRQAGRHLADAIDAGADCLVTPCPLCHLNLDMQQPAGAAVRGARPRHSGASPAPNGGPRAGAGAEGARHGQARRAHRGGPAQGRRARRRIAGIRSSRNG
jgi:succinate dehydrogenase / fumarate reductase cytochrome b subunit